MRHALGAVIESTGTGPDAATITISGAGGAGTHENYGALITDANTQIHTVDGDIHISGTGGDGTTRTNAGVRIAIDRDAGTVPLMLKLVPFDTSFESSSRG